MQPHNTKLKRFKLNPKYPHHRSEGLTHRRNAGSQYQDVTTRNKGNNPVTSY